MTSKGSCLNDKTLFLNTLFWLQSSALEIFSEKKPLALRALLHNKGMYLQTAYRNELIPINMWSSWNATQKRRFESWSLRNLKFRVKLWWEDNCHSRRENWQDDRSFTHWLTLHSLPQLVTSFPPSTTIPWLSYTSTWITPACVQQLWTS